MIEHISRSFMKRLLSLSILFCLALLPLDAQQVSAETNFYDAIYFFEEEEDFEEAQYLFLQVLEKETHNANAKYWLGMCYNNIEGQEHKGIPLLKQATQTISLKYKANRYKEKRAPHHSWFYLAEAYRLTNQPDEALDALTVHPRARRLVQVPPALLSVPVAIGWRRPPGRRQEESSCYRVLVVQTA